jgi:hypothetical protein
MVDFQPSEQSRDQESVSVLQALLSCTAAAIPLDMRAVFLTGAGKVAPSSSTHSRQHRDDVASDGEIHGRTLSQA